jgi:pyruvate kinase
LPAAPGRRMNDIPGIERRTKIVCTIGPATSSRAQLRALLERGMNVARLNFSHGEPAEHAAVLAGVRALSEELDVPTAVLQDLAGPKVRIGTLAHGSVELEPGRRFTLTTHLVEGSRDRVSVSYARLPAAVKVGDTLLLADGVIDLRVEPARRVRVARSAVDGTALKGAPRVLERRLIRASGRRDAERPRPIVERSGCSRWAECAAWPASTAARFCA